MFLIYIPFALSTLITTSYASVSMNEHHRYVMYAFYQAASDTAREKSMGFESPRVVEKVYFDTIASMYKSIASPAVTVTGIRSPVISHRELYKAISQRYTFRPIVLPNKMVALYAWLPHVPGAAHILMPSAAFYLILLLVSGNPKFEELCKSFVLQELRNANETSLVKYPKTLVPQINSKYRSNLFSEIFSTTVMLLNFMAVCHPTPKAFYDNFKGYLHA